ncbi:unnamed protein product [Ectocarpus sp. 12 AP-2014]
MFVVRERVGGLPATPRVVCESFSSTNAPINLTEHPVQPLPQVARLAAGYQRNMTRTCLLVLTFARTIRAHHFRKKVRSVASRLHPNQVKILRRQSNPHKQLRYKTCRQSGEGR